MTRAWLLVIVALAGCVVLGGCVDAGDPSWSLGHEHVVAVRAEPPALRPGESARLDGLIAHPAAPTSDDQPAVVVVVSPRELFTAVHYNIDHWQIDCPPVAEPTPLVVEMRFPAGDVATKTVMLGDMHENPAPPMVAIPDPVPLHADIALPAAEWFTSCGTLDAARPASDGQHTTLRVDEPCEGELVGVVRDLAGGVAWQVSPLHAR